jgi:hypothetical protein
MGGGGGGGGGTYNDLKDKSPQQSGLENRFYGMANDIMNQTNGRLLTNLDTAQRQSDNANALYDHAIGRGGQLTDRQDQALRNANTAAGSYKGRISDAYNRASGLINDSNQNLQAGSKSNEWYDQYSQGQLTGADELLKSGQIPQGLEDKFMDTINRGMKGSMGSMLNDLGGRGVLNSSVSSQGISRLGQQAADAYNDNYLNTFNSVLQGYQGNAAQSAANGKAFADTYMNLSNNGNDAARTAMSLGQAMQGSQDSDVANQLGISQGYGTALAGNLSERDQLQAHQPGYWDNAMGGTNWVKDFLAQMQQERASDTQTTVVEQGGK